MKKYLLFFALFGVVALLSSMLTPAEKIGYCNVEYIMAYYPANQQAQQSLANFRADLKSQMEGKYQVFQSKVEEMNKLTESDPARAEALQLELQKLQSEIVTMEADSKTQIAKKEQDLFDPVFANVQQAIDQVAAVNGFSFILNSSDGATSIVLHAPEANNVNNLILKSLGAPIPGE